MVRRLIRHRLRSRFISWRWLRFKRRLRFHYLNILRTDGTPHRIALGVAVGTLVGFLPIVPFQTITSFILCLLVRGSFVASLPTVQITNPVTIPFFYYLFFKLGQLVSPYGHSGEFPGIQEIMDMGMSLLWEKFSDAFLAMMVGGLVLGLFFGPVAYWFVRRNLASLRKREYRRICQKYHLACAKK